MTLTISDGSPVCTKIDVTTRHHSPFVVRGPMLAPQAASVSAGVGAAAANRIATPTITSIAAIVHVAIGYRARARRAASNASDAGVRRVAASLTSWKTSIAMPP